MNLLARTQSQVLTRYLARLLAEKCAWQSKRIFVTPSTYIWLIRIVSARPIWGYLIIKVRWSLASVYNWVFSSLSSPIHKVHCRCLADSKRVLSEVFVIIASAHPSFPKVFSILVGIRLGVGVFPWFYDFVSASETIPKGQEESSYRQKFRNWKSNNEVKRRSPVISLLAICKEGAQIGNCESIHTKQHLASHRNDKNESHTQNELSFLVIKLWVVLPEYDY